MPKENGTENGAQPAAIARKKRGNPNALTQNEKLVGRTLKKAVQLTEEEIAEVNSKKGLLSLLSTKNVNVRKALVKLKYEQELEKLQIELVKLQRDVQLNGRRIVALWYSPE